MDIIIQVENCLDRTGNMGCMVTVSVDENLYPKELSKIIGKIFYSNNRQYKENFAIYWRETPYSNIQLLKENLKKLLEKSNHNVLVLD